MSFKLRATFSGKSASGMPCHIYIFLSMNISNIYNFCHCTKTRACAYWSSMGNSIDFVHTCCRILTCTSGHCGKFGSQNSEQCILSLLSEKQACTSFCSETDNNEKKIPSENKNIISTIVYYLFYTVNIITYTNPFNC